jgi:4-hydroxyphenylacetate 3-monooxygenase
MLKTGKEFSRRPSRRRTVYVGSERIDDVTRHPAFRNAAQSIADIYDMKADPPAATPMSYEEEGERFSLLPQGARPRRSRDAHDAHRRSPR